MDTTKTNIKMCEKAEEIQREKKHIERGDYWCWKSFPERVYFRAERTPLEMFDSRNKRECNNKVWLPRQDELQEMLDMAQISKLEGVLQFLKESWVVDTDYAPFSMEQLWLAFVMKEKYGKVWNGSSWEERNI